MSSTELLDAATSYRTEGTMTRIYSYRPVSLFALSLFLVPYLRALLVPASSFLSSLYLPLLLTVETQQIAAAAARTPTAALRGGWGAKEKNREEAEPASSQHERFMNKVRRRCRRRGKGATVTRIFDRGASFVLSSALNFPPLAEQKQLEVAVLLVAVDDPELRPFDSQSPKAGGNDDFDSQKKIASPCA